MDDDEESKDEDMEEDSENIASLGKKILPGSHQKKKGKRWGAATESE